VREIEQQSKGGGEKYARFVGINKAIKGKMEMPATGFHSLMVKKLD